MSDGSDQSEPQTWGGSASVLPLLDFQPSRLAPGLTGSGNEFKPGMFKFEGPATQDSTTNGFRSASRADRRTRWQGARRPPGARRFYGAGARGSGPRPSECSALGGKKREKGVVSSGL